VKRTSLALALLALGYLAGTLAPAARASDVGLSSVVYELRQIRAEIVNLHRALGRR
jgi:hypothetical protein